MHVSMNRILLLWAAVLLPPERQRIAMGYVLPSSLRTKNCHPSPSTNALYSSPNTYSGLTSTGWGDDDDDDESNKMKNKNKHRIEFSNFWGSKYAIGDDEEDEKQGTVPFVPSLDPHDGPLPPGAYVSEGKPEFDAKPTCRIAVGVRLGTTGASASQNKNDPDEAVRRLQACVDAGLNTFQPLDQTREALDLVRRMKENTPSYVQTHWSFAIKAAQTTSASLGDESSDKNINNHFDTRNSRSDLRHSVLDLIERTGSDALDSLVVDVGTESGRVPSSPTSSLSSHGATLEVFEHLADLQREGWIRSIGIGGTDAPPGLLRDIATYFGDHIDFEQREGSLLVPPSFSFRGGLSVPGDNSHKNKVRMGNALAGGLLTDLYDSDARRQTNYGPRPPLLTNENMRVLNEWASRREKWREESPETTGPPSTQNMPVWNQYQEHALGPMARIASKHDVSIAAVALRWALECAGTNGLSGGKGIVSSALADLFVGGPADGGPPFRRKTTELRGVFRFELEEEDREVLSGILATGGDEQAGSSGDGDGFGFGDDGGDGYPAIDFDNPKFWL